jgi:hypothetical protein
MFSDILFIYDLFLILNDVVCRLEFDLDGLLLSYYLFRFCWNGLLLSWMVS